MKKTIYVILIAFLFSQCKNDENAEINIRTDFPEITLEKIGFGSCHHQLFKPFKAFQSLSNQNVDLFLFNGDNIYGDLFAIAPGTEEFMRNSYAKLFENRDFRNFYNAVPFITTWDDHDYGQNDGVADNRAKHYAKKLFFEVWNIPENHPRRMNPDGGIYGSYYYGEEDKRVQIITLDLRWNQSVRSGNQISGWDMQTNPARTMLGETQWKWLEEELKKPAKVRVIMSSLKFASSYSGDEAWAIFPHERQRMLDLIKSTQAEGVVFISGDVHYAEFSAISDEPNLYPIYDMTSSGMTHLSSSADDNDLRISEPFIKFNYGIINIDWTGTPTIIFEINDINGNVGLQKSISLDELTFK
jgi:alkaline phosphatase D